MEDFVTPSFYRKEWGLNPTGGHWYRHVRNPSLPSHKEVTFSTVGFHVHITVIWYGRTIFKGRVHVMQVPFRKIRHLCREWGLISMHEFLLMEGWR